MLLVFALAITTLAISGIAAFFSIYGLAAIFTSAFIPSLIMGASLEAGKLLIISFLYRFWHKINWLFKSYIMGLVLLLIVFTSIGIFGYLSASYQSGAIELNETNQKVIIIDQQKKFYEDRLVKIDEQLNIPTQNIGRKIQLIKTLQTEKDNINKKLEEISQQKIELLSKTIKSEAKVGPITFVSKALGKPVENSIIYLIFFIMIIFDPLAIALTIATNMTIKNKKDKPKELQSSTLEIPEEISYNKRKSELINSIKA